MDDNIEFLPFKKPLHERFKRLVFSYLVAFIIGLTGAISYIVVYSVQYYGAEQLVWGIGQALLPESEVKQELAKLQDELHQVNGKLANITKAITSARKLSSGSSTVVPDGRARLASPAVVTEKENSLKPKNTPKKPVISPAAQGGGEDEPDSVLDSILNRLKGASSRIEALESKNYTTIMQSTPIGVPVAGELTSEFGSRSSPFSGFRQNHRGIDVAMNRGAELYATADGSVAFAGWGGAYGNQIIIDHGVATDGDRFETLYAHLSKIYVKVGAQIKRGERIGQVGTTGHSTGPHVHYEVRKNGVPVDPEPFVQLASLLD